MSSVAPSRVMLDRTENGIWLTLGYFELGLCWHAGNWCVTGGWLDPRP
jgi:hypothetical protein